MSDIHGTGYGSSHNWKREITDQFTFRGGTVFATRYRCRDCHEVFVHPYHDIPGIFEAMEYRGVTDKCPAIMQENAKNKD